MSKLLLLLKLSFSGSSVLVKLSVFTIPFITLSSLYLVFISDALVTTYVDRVERSYLGALGRFEITTKDGDFIDLLSKQMDNAEISHAKRFRYSLPLLWSFEDDKKILKNIDWTLDIPARQQADVTNGQYSINHILHNHFGDYFPKLRAIRLEDQTLQVDTTQLAIIDTGFLTPNPILFATLDKIPLALTQSGLRPKVSIVLTDSYQDFSDIKNFISALARDNSLATIEYVDRIKESRDSQVFFNYLQISQIGFSFALISLILWLNYLALSTLVANKRKSLITLNTIGYSRGQLVTHFIIIVMSIVMLCGLASFIMTRQTLDYVAQLAEYEWITFVLSQHTTIGLPVVLVFSSALLYMSLQRKLTYK